MLGRREVVLGLDLGEAAVGGTVVEEEEEGLGAFLKGWEVLRGPAEDGGVEGADAGEVQGWDLGPCYGVGLGSVSYDWGVGERRKVRRGCTVEVEDASWVVGWEDILSLLCLAWV